MRACACVSLTQREPERDNCSRCFCFCSISFAALVISDYAPHVLYSTLVYYSLSRVHTRTRTRRISTHAAEHSYKQLVSYNALIGALSASRLRCLCRCCPALPFAVGYTPLPYEYEYEFAVRVTRNRAICSALLCACEPAAAAAGLRARAPAAARES